MFSLARTVLISIMALLLAACGTVQVGQDFDLRSLEAKIERGVTNQNQIRAWLGAPASSGVSVDTSGERFDEWTYYFASGKVSGMSNTHLKILQLKFDKQGVVRGYNWSASGQ